LIIKGKLTLSAMFALESFSNYEGVPSCTTWKMILEKKVKEKVIQG